MKQFQFGSADGENVPTREPLGVDILQRNVNAANTFSSSESDPVRTDSVEMCFIHSQAPQLLHAFLWWREEEQKYQV